MKCSFIVHFRKKQAYMQNFPSTTNHGSSTLAHMHTPHTPCTRTNMAYANGHGSTCPANLVVIMSQNLPLQLTKCWNLMLNSLNSPKIQSSSLKCNSLTHGDIERPASGILREGCTLLNTLPIQLRVKAPWWKYHFLDYWVDHLLKPSRSLKNIVWSVEFIMKK